MKAICFIISDYYKRYSFLFNNMRYGDNVGRDESLFTTTSILDLLIRTEGEICGNQKSTYDNRGGRGGRQQKL